MKKMLLGPQLWQTISRMLITATVAIIKQ